MNSIGAAKNVVENYLTNGVSKKTVLFASIAVAVGIVAIVFFVKFHQTKAALQSNKALMNLNSQAIKSNQAHYRHLVNLKNTSPDLLDKINNDYLRSTNSQYFNLLHRKEILSLKNQFLSYQLQEWRKLCYGTLIVSAAFAMATCVSHTWTVVKQPHKKLDPITVN